MPILAAVDDDQGVFGHFAGLREGHHFPELVHGAETAGENNEGFGDLCEPELAHEEVVEVEAELGADVRIGELLMRQFDREADGLTSGFIGTAVGGFHDAGTAAGSDYEAARSGAER